MVELSVSGLKKSFADDLLFEQITFDLKTEERLGLIGPNGSGKTTLLKIVYGLESMDEGAIAVRKDGVIGYLDQIPDYHESLLVDDIVQMAFKDLYEIKNKLDEVSLKLGQTKGHELDKYLKEYTRLQALFEQKGGYDIETEINKVTTGLQISSEMRQMPFSLLSGGEKTRVMLAKILLESPSILMLDEPSNHLDLESIEWLESYLKQYKGSVLIVSHDRYFLDNVCNKIVELSTYKAHLYYGNYSYYVIEKERRFLLELKAYLAQQKEIKRMEEQIKRYRIWGVMRDSDKMFKRAKELEKRLEKIDRLQKPKQDQTLSLYQQVSHRSGKRVLEAKSINKAYGDLVIFKDASLDIIYQDRLAILGSNGTGKTSLLHLLMDDFKKEEQDFKWGSKLNLGYLAQEVIFEDDSLTVLDFFMNTHNVSQPLARNQLATALFIRDDVHKKISVLSGGEKSKLILCSLMYDNPNILVLDEPTNHLDIDSRETLEDMLLAFEGTILFVSHDRYFIQKIATRIGEINHEKLEFYEGNYDYYRSLKERLKQDVKKPKDKAPKTVTKTPKKRNYKKDLEMIEEKLHKLYEEIDLHAYDALKLEELYKEKNDLEEEYEELFESMEEDM
jgi:ATPase subunit of ABC transporter with duplicated ATPase domains